MMDCKKSLTDSGGDMDKAMQILREKGLAAAAKKAGRIAADGLVVSVINKDKKIGVVLEVNSETDFVAKNKDFVAFVNAVANTVIDSDPTDVDELLAMKLSGSDDTVEQALQEKILKIGENIKVRRFERLEGELASYVHGNGAIGVMVKFNTDLTAEGAFEAYGKDVAMQIAAANPQFVTKDEVPAETLESEKNILLTQAVNEGKPENIAQKMVQGRISKYFKEFCLVDQAFVKDANLSVKQYTDNTAKELGGSIEIIKFVRFEKGEGLEKREDNFADEVAGMIK
ncbi:MAG: translation elongation factor Ts [Oscillospiraceae bacterium]|nr:translation elongation factor Ts [Oscillospiraceae bacterium]